MVAVSGYFAWYELMTTDVAAAAAFYRDAVGWGSQEASTSKLHYTLFTAGETPAAGLMELPEEGRRMGAMPRWMGYIGVRDLHATVGRIKRLGGATYVPPTDTNIGLISVVADPHAATFALIEHARVRPQQPTEGAKAARVGWHELHTADLDSEFSFYCELFGWRKVDDEPDPVAPYYAFSAGGQVIGGAFNKHPAEPVPFWLFYFNVEDLDAALARVSTGGGTVVSSDVELPGGFRVARCVDPQGAAFALQSRQAHIPKVGWSTEWRGFSSRGQLVAPKSRRAPSADS